MSESVKCKDKKKAKKKKKEIKDRQVAVTTPQIHQYTNI